MGQRADAIRNRALLVEAGREVFAERGPDASLEEIARRAGVGIGTLYRHFPTRDALIETIYAEHIGEVEVLAKDAAEAEDAWAGLSAFLDGVLELQARNLPLRAAFLQRTDGGGGLVAERRQRILPLLERLVERARSEGMARSDLTIGDVLAAMWSFAPVFEATAEIAPEVWRRHLTILLDGMRPTAATAQTARPLTRPQVEAAIRALQARYHRKRAA